jgi:hypothetical protein
VPALAGGTPALDDLMLNNLNRLQGRQVNDLAAIVDTAAAQGVLAIGAVVKGVGLGAGRYVTAPPTIVLGCTLLARTLGFVGFDLVGLDEGWRVVALLFEFGDARHGRSKLLLQRRDLRGEGRMLNAEVGKLITQRLGAEYTRPLGKV